MQPELFNIHVSDEVLDDLKRRINNTRWPSDVDNSDWRYGFNAEYLRPLAERWGNEFDWRAVEREINSFSHYRAEVDGVPVHYIREPGRGPKPIPLIISHGWPSSFWEMHKIIRPLADPAAYGGDPADAFDVIVPSLPGFGYSTPLKRAGLSASVATDIWHKLMTEVLGFDRFAASGGDWGSRLTSELGHKYASSLYGIHILGTTPLDLFNHERYWDITAAFVPYDTPPEVRKAILPFVTKAISHVAVQSLEPQTLSYAMHDSPVGQLAWITQRWRDWGHTHGDVIAAFGADFLLTNAMLYWVTESFGSSVRYYRDAVLHPWRPSHDRTPRIEAPTGITFLGGENPPGITTENRVEIFRNSSAAAGYNLQFVNAHEFGGHFGYLENPQACIDDIRATFRGLR
ncbi:MAG: epoxide hydrolase [Gammaproteobacteria bacterium BRH_c0]|nr:MAG: epoxide hydrolase [Gammaproteobacteria bacterium BRH_c0]